jgi:hypothetical protein
LVWTVNIKNKEKPYLDQSFVGFFGATTRRNLLLQGLHYLMEGLNLDWIKSNMMVTLNRDREGSRVGIALLYHRDKNIGFIGFQDSVCNG